MKKLLLLTTCLWAWVTTFAQNSASLTGKIISETSQPLAQATVKLVKFPGGEAIQETQSSADGQFTFKQVQPGSYGLIVGLVGYQAYKSASITVGDQNLSLPVVKLEGISHQLKEVAIEVKKNYVERKADKTILNVEGSLLASGSTALEVLEKAPGVTIDRQSEQIKLNNKSGITVMIDGKTNFLSGADVTTLLGNMSSEQIATIELITNPSSKYDAAGNAGIINIRLKRNKAFGTNGSLSLNTGKGVQPNFPSDTYRAGLSLTLNHRVAKWNIYGTAAFNRKVAFNTTNVLRTTTTASLASAFDQNFERNNTGVAYMGKIGADYYASERTVIGVMIDANTIRSVLNNESQALITERQLNVETLNSVHQLARSISPVSNLSANFNIRHDLDKNGKSLTFDADYSRFNNEKTENFDARYMDQQLITTKETLLKNSTFANINVMAGKSDLSLPINKTMKLEAGLKSSYVITKNELLAEQLSNGNWLNDAGKSNYFIYKENINAAYTNISKDWKKWQVQMGLRMEYTHANGRSVTANSSVKRDYLSLFPTVFVNQVLSASHQLRYSFSRRVDRPNYQQLNPFVFYMDPYALDEGNPYLDPQFTYNFELGYSYKEMGLSFNYADTRDLITQISQQNEVTRIVNVIRKNLGRAQNYSLNLYVPVNIRKFWSMQHNFSLYYNQFDDDNLEGAKYTANKVGYNFNASHSFILPRNFTLEISFWLNSPSVHGVEQTTITQSALNAAVQKSLLQKKLKIRLGMDDIFLTNHWEGRLQYQNVNLNVVNHYLSRRASFTVNYSFGNQNVKSSRKRSTAADDLKNRAN